MGLVGAWVFGNIAPVKAAFAPPTSRSMMGAMMPGNDMGADTALDRRGPGGEDHMQFLADALGISLEDLQTAYDTARTAGIKQAVELGLITQEQADNMLVWGGGHPGFEMRGFGPGDKTSTIDQEALLADALGITVEKLQTAQETAQQAAITQAVADGTITQAQADEMLARKALQSYLDRNTLLATALGITTDELTTAYANGETLSTLMAKQGLDAATVRENLTAAREAAIAQAVTDGVITQAQADAMETDPGMMGMRGMGGHGGRGGHGMGGFEGGFGGRGGQPPADLDTNSTSQSNDTL